LVEGILSFWSSTYNSYSQITRGAQPGEIYISTDWYIDNIGDIHYGIFHSTDNGENITLKYENIEVPQPGEMTVGAIIGDATTGALYNMGNNESWVSFDHGENWEFREDFIDYIRYWGGSNEGLIYKGGWGLLYKSNDYAQNYEIVADPPTCPISDVGLFDGEFWGIDGNAGEPFSLYHTHDYANTYSELLIDSSVAFWAIGGYYPQISRGSESGELFLTSWWPDYHYKVFYSADSGYTWVEKFESEYIDIYYWRVFFTAGRDSGSFYVLRSRVCPAGDHVWLYIDYSNDFGETFMTYFHDLDSTITSVNTFAQLDSNWSIYPNPAKNQLTIEISELIYESLNLEIIDAVGRTVRSSIINNNKTVISIEDLRSGVYYCKISGGRIFNVEKFMKH
jgi:hypothetical protein